MKSMPLLEGWNRSTSLAVFTAIICGFFAGVFAISVPFTHSLSFGAYRIAIFFGVAFFLFGMVITDFYLSRVRNEFRDELEDRFFLRLFNTRVYKGFYSGFFLMYAVTFFTWFLLRTQFQWTNTVLGVAQSIVYFFFCIFAYVSVRNENFEHIQKYHKLPELDFEEDKK